MALPPSEESSTPPTTPESSEDPVYNVPNGQDHALAQAQGYLSSILTYIDRKWTRLPPDSPIRHIREGIACALGHQQHVSSRAILALANGIPRPIRDVLDAVLTLAERAIEDRTTRYGHGPAMRHLAAALQTAVRNCLTEIDDAGGLVRTPMAKLPRPARRTRDELRALEVADSLEARIKGLTPVAEMTVEGMARLPSKRMRHSDPDPADPADRRRDATPSDSPPELATLPGPFDDGLGVLSVCSLPPRAYTIGDMEKRGFDMFDHF